ncbi:oxidoreductase [Actinokineospora sp. G85]|uniref:oxidoreductase n=1 Tax=Actinokineospora sp. G85 TaxID=3406626 RepID=UPI003C739A35
MVGALVVGLGRSGAGLHLPVLRALGHGQARALGRPPIVVVDPAASVPPAPDVLPALSLAHAARLISPARTVVHLCTPPTARLRPLTELAGLGFTRVLVEKPLAVDEVELAGVLRLRAEAGLDLLPVAQWRCSELTRRITAVVAGGELGALRSLSFTQTKPRFTRTALGDSHTTALDVEAPHSVAVALHVAGAAEVADAALSDMVVGDHSYRHMGGARLSLRHAGGVRTEIRTDLTSPVRERRVVAELEGGTLIGHYPATDADDHSQLVVRTASTHSHSVFQDDSLRALIARAHEHFEGGDPLFDEPANGVAVVTLLAQAKRLATAQPAPTRSLAAAL